MNAVDVQRAVDDEPADADAAKLDPKDAKPEPEVEEVAAPASDAPPERAQPPPPRPSRHPWRRPGRHIARQRLKIAAGLAAYLALLGLAFYAGKAHQSSADQQLYAAYHPAGGASAGRGGTGGPTDQLVAAALSIGNPPGSGPSSSASPAPQSTAPATGGQGAAPTLSVVAGQLSSVSGQALSVQPSQGGRQPVAIASSTRFYVVSAAPTSSLAVGQRVVVSTSRDSSGTSTATGITISPAGTAPVEAQSSSRAQGSGGSIYGTVTAVAADSMSLQTRQGTTVRLRLGGTTPVYRVDRTTMARIKAGMAVAVEVTAVDGHAVATDVVASGIPGIAPRLSAVRSATAEQGG
jgi:hypothetical protein